MYLTTKKKREASIRANNQVVEKVIKEKPIAKIRDKPILTITEAATYIGVTRPTLYGYLKRGELKATRLEYKFLVSISFIVLTFLYNKIKYIVAERYCVFCLLKKNIEIKSKLSLNTSADYSLQVTFGKD